MSEPAYDDYGIDAAMALDDWMEIVEADLDEVADGLENQSQIDKLVAFLRRKAEEIAGMELFDDDDDAELEPQERDEEECE
jgi:hypothetical protein